MPRRIRRKVFPTPKQTNDAERVVVVEFHESFALIWINVWLGGRDIDYTFLAAIILGILLDFGV